MQPRTLGQNNQMWSLASQLSKLVGEGEGEARMRNIIEEITGQRSTRRLTYAQAEEVKKRLAKDIAVIARHKGRQQAAPGDLPTPAQLATIESIRATLHISLPGLQSIAKKACGRAWPQTREEAGKLHNALAAIWNRDVRKGGPALMHRVAALQGRDGLDHWKRKFLADISHRIAAQKRIPPGAFLKFSEIEDQLNRPPGPTRPAGPIPKEQPHER